MNPKVTTPNSSGTRVEEGESNPNRDMEVRVVTDTEVLVAGTEEVKTLNPEP